MFKTPEWTRVVHLLFKGKALKRNRSDQLLDVLWKCYMVQPDYEMSSDLDCYFAAKCIGRARTPESGIFA